jgi:hypothetical protein
MDPALWYSHPLSGVHVDLVPCDTCEYGSVVGDKCPQEDFGLTPGWREVGGRLPPQHLGVGARCPRWRPVGATRHD